MISTFISEIRVEIDPDRRPAAKQHSHRQR
jgi:hypothetical protein